MSVVCGVYAVLSAFFHEFFHLAHAYAVVEALRVLHSGEVHCHEIAVGVHHRAAARTWQGRDGVEYFAGIRLLRDVALCYLCLYSLLCAGNGESSVVAYHEERFSGKCRLVAFAFVYVEYVGIAGSLAAFEL